MNNKSTELLHKLTGTYSPETFPKLWENEQAVREYISELESLVDRLSWAGADILASTVYENQTVEKLLEENNLIPLVFWRGLMNTIKEKTNGTK